MPVVVLLFPQPAKTIVEASIVQRMILNLFFMEIPPLIVEVIVARISKIKLKKSAFKNLRPVFPNGG